MRYSMSHYEIHNTCTKLTLTLIRLRVMKLGLQSNWLIRNKLVDYWDKRING